MINKKNSIKKIILVISLTFFFSSVLIFNSNLSSASTNSKYKEYENKFKNQKSKNGYTKIKYLKKHDKKTYVYYKSFCATHKLDSDAQFKKIPVKDQQICKNLYSYKGYKNYIYYRDKKENNDNNEVAFVCGTTTVKDADNNEYDTSIINGQCWMAKNINVGTRLASGSTDPTNNGIIEKWCYDNDSTICDTDGGLYSWNEAMQYSTSEGTHGICPTGWHIPTDAQYYVLENYLKDGDATCNASRSGSGDCASAGTKLKSSESPFFNGKLAGINSGGTFGSRNTYGLFWSSSESSDNAWIRGLSSSDTTMRGTRSKAYGISVRCLKN